MKPIYISNPYTISKWELDDVNLISSLNLTFQNFNVRRMGGK